MNDDLERELEQMLHRVIDPIAARPIPPRRAVHSRSAIKTVSGGAGAALTLKVLAGAVAAAAAVTVGGAAATGSVNPANWGTAVTQRVQTCKDNLANSGGHGIGPCVSPSTHGAAVSGKAHHQGKAKGHGNSGNGNGNGNGNGSASSSRGNNGSNGHANGKSKTHPTAGSKSGSPHS